MAFNRGNFARNTVAYNTGAVTLADSSVVNGPAQFTYQSQGDTLATISAANYFADPGAIWDLKVGDWIFANGSDAYGALAVTAVNTTANTITTESTGLTTSIGTANLVDGAVTTAKLADLNVTTGKLAANAVDTSKLALNTIQYAQVTVTLANFIAMYTTPVLLVAAAGANTLICMKQVQVAQTYGSAALASGGVSAIQYDSTAHGAGVIASTTLTAASYFQTASTVYTYNPGVVLQPFSTAVNKGLYLSCLTGDFTTGTASTFKVNVWYSVIATA